MKTRPDTPLRVERYAESDDGTVKVWVPNGGALHNFTVEPTDEEGVDYRVHSYGTHLPGRTEHPAESAYWVAVAFIKAKYGSVRLSNTGYASRYTSETATHNRLMESVTGGVKHIVRAGEETAVCGSSVSSFNTGVVWNGDASPGMCKRCASAVGVD